MRRVCLYIPLYMYLNNKGYTIYHYNYERMYDSLPDGYDIVTPAIAYKNKMAINEKI